MSARPPGNGSDRSSRRRSPRCAIQPLPEPSARCPSVRASSTPLEEGLAHGDLFIEGGGLAGVNLKSLVEEHYRVPGRYILSTKGEGSIEGFDIESGIGCALYRKQLPDGRRLGLERIERHRRSRLGPVLSLRDKARLCSTTTRRWSWSAKMWRPLFGRPWPQPWWSGKTMVVTRCWSCWTTPGHSRWSVAAIC